MFRKRFVVGSGLAVCAVCGAASAQDVVFPLVPHAGYNFIPFGSDPGNVMHQVFNADLFRGLLSGGATTVQIEKIGFASADFRVGQFNEILDVEINLGYTDKVPGQPPPVGLDIPSVGTNPNGPMTLFFEDARIEHIGNSPTSNDFDLVLEGTPFEYDPARGNLLVEIKSSGIANSAGAWQSWSRSGGSPESSRSYEGGRFAAAFSTTTATRMQFTYSLGTGCYPDCNDDGVLDFFDFLCFQNAFLAQDPYADCDGNNVFDFFDFLCFQNEFLAGCP